MTSLPAHFASAFLAAWVLTVLIESAVLAVALSPRHPLSERLFAGFWLSSVTLPIVWMVIPALVDPAAHRVAYLAVAEVFAPLAECALFYRLHPASTGRRDLCAIVLANLVSFSIGLLL